jgi:hypothetical protein
MPATFQQAQIHPGVPGTLTTISDTNGNACFYLTTDGSWTGTLILTNSPSITANPALLIGTPLTNCVNTFVVVDGNVTAINLAGSTTSTANYYVANAAALLEPQGLTDGEMFEFRAAMASRVLHARWRAIEEKHRRDQAARRAFALLSRYLTPEQQADYAAEGAFRVMAPSRQCYRIRKGTYGNVDMLDADGNVQHRLCIHPAGELPDEDTMLAQLLMIRFAEDEFLRIAIRHPPRPEDRVAAPPPFTAPAMQAAQLPLIAIAG